jgi:hypothetical protein
MRQLLFFALILVALLASCKLMPGKKENTGKAVARVNDRYLYPEDLQGMVPPGTSATDSAGIVSAYINDWIRQQLLLKQAEDNLDESNREFSRQIEQYRNSLIIYAYESELVKQKLDTIVPMSEIEAYYRDNQGNFLLRENIVQANIVKLPLNSPLGGRMKSLLLSNRDADRNKLMTLCQENGAEYQLAGEEWMSFADLVKKVPLSVDDQLDFLSHNKYFEVKDSTLAYLVALVAFKNKENISPLNFVSGNIRAVLLNKRKADLIKKMEDDLFGEAEKRGKYEVFKK